MDEVWHPSEQWSISERRVWQERRLLEVVQSAWEHAPSLRERVGTAGLKPHKLTIESLSKLPILHKDEYLNAQRSAPPFAGWLGVGLQDAARLFRSPGPILDPEGRDDDYGRFAPALFAAGIRPGDVVLNTLSYHLTPDGHMVDGGLRAMRCVVVPSGPNNIEVQVQLLDEYAITGFVGTSSFLATVLDAARQAGSTPRLRCAFVVGDVMPESLRQRLHGQYQVTVRQGYGTPGLGSIAYECSASNGMHVTRETLVELINPTTGRPAGIGEVGEIVVSALNPTYPLMRFGTGDLAFMAVGECACGRTGPRLDRLVGRIGDAVKVRGVFVHPFELDSVMARYPEVARYQAVVTRDGDADELLVQVELASDASTSPLVRDRLTQAVNEGLRVGTNVEIVPTGTLAGKANRIVDQRT
jgi:phenylacetate-coenzyme A ligase PaaK-like adenylate-forming protein